MWGLQRHRDGWMEVVRGGWPPFCDGGCAGGCARGMATRLCNTLVMYVGDGYDIAIWVTWLPQIDAVPYHHQTTSSSAFPSHPQPLIARLNLGGEAGEAISLRGATLLVDVLCERKLYAKVRVRCGQAVHKGGYSVLASSSTVYRGG